MLGVSQYLTPADLDRTFGFVRGMPSESEIVFTIAVPDDMLQPDEVEFVAALGAANRRIDYARVTTYGQTLDVQLEQLRAEGCRKIDHEKGRSAQVARRELLKLLKNIRQPTGLTSAMNYRFFGRPILPYTCWSLLPCHARFAPNRTGSTRIP